VKTILLVDDEYSIIELLAQLFEEEGYAVLIAANGQEGLDRAAETVPDLVITDQMMPLMNGAELFRALKKDPKLRRVPVILVTSTPLAASRDLAWAEFVPKPFNFDELLSVVRRVLGA